MRPAGHRNALFNLIFFLGTVCFGSNASADDAWDFDLAVYGWLPNIDVELPSGQKTEITRSDIVDNLDMAAMARLRASRDRWSLTTDIIYFDLQNDDRAPVTTGLDLRKLGLQASLIKPSIGYQVFESGGSRVELYAGGRYFWAQPTLKFQLVPPLPTESYEGSKSDSRWDGMVGVRAEHPLAAHWFLPWYADVGAGDSDSVVDVFAGIGYRFRNFDLVAAWRYMDYDFGDGWVLKTMTINGPLVGVEFTF